MTERIHFQPTDRYRIDGAPFFYVDANDTHGFFRREDGSEAIERFDWMRLRKLAEQGLLVQEKRSRDIATAMAAPPEPQVGIWEMPEHQRDLVLHRWFFVTAFLWLHAAGEIRKTKPSVAAQYATLRERAAREAAACREDGKRSYFSTRANGFAHDASPSSILNWVTRYQKTGRLDALVDRRGRRSKLEIDAESYRFLIRHLREFLTLQRCGKAVTVDQTLKAMQVENARRRQEGLPLLETRGRTVLFDWINRFDPFEIEVARHGLTRARRKFAAVGRTEQATRPGEIFQMDEWEIDARSVILNGPIREGLEQETLQRLPKTRRWLYVVIDVATRYVVGLVVASSQNSASAIRALEMATRDKPELAAAVGAEHDWRGFRCEAVASDTGSAFRAAATHRTVTEMASTMTHALVGQPQLRGIIERLFGTFTSRVMPFLPGRTFSNPKERGDYDTEGLAVLTDEDLAKVFIRYITDVYHQTPHGGLLGETPAEALERLSGQYGLPLPLSIEMRRRAFGIRMERSLSPSGLSLLGIHYNSDALQKIRRHTRLKTLTFYVDPADIGTIGVWTGEDWLDVGCSVESFHGITLADWLAVGEVLRRRYSGAATVKAQSILTAYASIQDTAQTALKRAGVLPGQPTAEDLDRLEKDLYHGLSVVEEQVPSATDLTRVEDGIGYVITDDGGPQKRLPLSEDDLHLSPSDPFETTYPMGSVAPDIPDDEADERPFDDEDWLTDGEDD